MVIIQGILLFTRQNFAQILLENKFRMDGFANFAPSHDNYLRRD